MGDVNWVALAVFVLLFAFITVLGFVAANWRKGDLDLLHEWGLGGRRFGTVITWFLIGGDLYTAYTFVAVPALAHRLTLTPAAWAAGTDAARIVAALVDIVPGPPTVARSGTRP